MTIIQTISTPPTAPSRSSDTASQFSTNVDAYLSYMTTLISEINTYVTQTNLMYSNGSWTPTLTTDGTDFTSVTYDAVTSGKYNRVGDIVFIQGNIRTDSITVGSASGNVLIGGLPFASHATNDQGAIAVGWASTFTGDVPIEGLIKLNATTIALYSRATADVASTNVVVADVIDQANSNNIYFSGQYNAVAG